MKTRVTTKNMISIPAAIARRFNISPGCHFEWQPLQGSADEIRVRVIPKRGDLARKLKGAGAQCSPERDAVAELIRERAAEV